MTIKQDWYDFIFQQAYIHSKKGLLTVLQKGLFKNI